MRSRILCCVACCLLILTGPALVGAATEPLTHATPRPSIGARPSVGTPAVTESHVPKGDESLPIFRNPPLIQPPVDGFNFDDDVSLLGNPIIPPDPNVAVGPNHVINIGNCIMEWRSTASPGTVINQQTLQSFFSALPPAPGPGTTLGTIAFDPKVIYDQYAGRFVVVALEEINALPSMNASRLLVAVSKTSDPTAGWWFHAIDSKMSIGGVDSWAD